MAEQRTIDLQMDAETQMKIREAATVAEYNNAVGYLASWNMSFGYVSILGGVYDGNPEITATYRKEAGGPIGYQIGAVWHTDHFGFHS